MTKRENMKKYLLMTTTLLLLLACETGVKNKGKTTEPLLSGIVERTDTPSQYSSKGSNYKQSYSKASTSRIFSKSAQPGYYLQMAIFKKNRPSKAFLKPLDSSNFSYIVLNKSTKDYVLIGPYLSYNTAKSKVSSVKSSLGKQTFVVQVLRP